MGTSGRDREAMAGRVPRYAASLWTSELCRSAASARGLGGGACKPNSCSVPPARGVMLGWLQSASQPLVEGPPRCCPRSHSHHKPLNPACKELFPNPAADHTSNKVSPSASGSQPWFEKSLAEGWTGKGRRPEASNSVPHIPLWGPLTTRPQCAHPVFLPDLALQPAGGLEAAPQSRNTSSAAECKASVPLRCSRDFGRCTLRESALGNEQSSEN